MPIRTGSQAGVAKPGAALSPSLFLEELWRNCPLVLLFILLLQTVTVRTELKW